MNREIDIVSNRLSGKALFFLPNVSSLFFCVLLSYYNLSRCYLIIKTFSHCLITMTYYHATTHRAYARNSTGILFVHKEKIMNYNIVRVHHTDLMLIIKTIKYLMLATMTGCLVYIALWLYGFQQVMM